MGDEAGLLGVSQMRDEFCITIVMAQWVETYSMYEYPKLRAKGGLEMTDHVGAMKAGLGALAWISVSWKAYDTLGMCSARGEKLLCWAEASRP